MGNPKRIFIQTDAKKITEILLRQDGKKAKNCFDKFEKSKTTALTSLIMTTEKIEKQNRKLKCENTF